MTDEHLIALARRQLETRRADVIEQIGCLLSSIPGDPGVVRWPPMLERECAALEAERDLLEEQIRTLCAVERQIRRGLVA